MIATPRAGTALADPKLKALRQFTVAMTHDRGWPSEADVQTFSAAGYTKQTMLEVVLGISYKVLSNYTNHLAHTDVDGAFSADAWKAA